MEHKLGIIGFGGMASWHYENIKRIDGLEVVAAHDISAERIAAAQELGIKTHTQLADFLADDSFDMVLVATPNNFHKQMTIAALEAGKHVICEKPVAMNAAELQEMMDTAKRVGRVFTVHQNRRWDRDYQMVRQTVQSGKIGKLYSIESRVHGQNGILFGWRNKKVPGGGVLRDWGVHMIDQLLDLIDEKVTQVYAQMFSVLSDEVEDYYKLLLRFESGISATVEVGTFCFVMGPRWYVHGDEGSIIINDWDCEGQIVTGKDFSANWNPAVVQTVAGPTRTMAPRDPSTLLYHQLPDVSAQSDWCDYYKNVMAAIEGREELIVKPCQAMRVLQIIDAAFLSEEQGQSIKTDI